jgi:hypothetical protein
MCQRRDSLYKAVRRPSGQDWSVPCAFFLVCLRILPLFVCLRSFLVLLLHAFILESFELIMFKDMWDLFAYRSGVQPTESNCRLTAAAPPSHRCHTLSHHLQKRRCRSRPEVASCHAVRRCIPASNAFTVYPVLPAPPPLARDELLRELQY